MLAFDCGALDKFNESSEPLKIWNSNVVRLIYKQTLSLSFLCLLHLREQPEKVDLQFASVAKTSFLFTIFLLN